MPAKTVSGQLQHVKTKYEAYFEAHHIAAVFDTSYFSSKHAFWALTEIRSVERDGWVPENTTHHGSIRHSCNGTRALRVYHTVAAGIDRSVVREVTSGQNLKKKQQLHAEGFTPDIFACALN